MFLGLLDENETKKDYKNNYHSLNNPSLKDNSDSGEQYSVRTRYNYRK